MYMYVCLTYTVQLKSICVEFDPGSYVVNYGFIYALCGGQVSIPRTSNVNEFQ